MLRLLYFLTFKSWHKTTAVLPLQISSYGLNINKCMPFGAPEKNLPWRNTCQEMLTESSSNLFYSQHKETCQFSWLLIFTKAHRGQSFFTLFLIFILKEFNLETVWGQVYLNEVRGWPTVSTDLANVDAFHPIHVSISCPSTVKEDGVFTFLTPGSITE